MKKISVILASALALVAFSSCREELPVVEAPGVDAPEQIRLAVSAVSPGTRMTGVSAQSGRNDSFDEAKVNTLQVLVFNGESLDGYGSSVNKNTVVVTCTSGSRDIYAVVNGPDLNQVTSKQTLLAMASSLAEEPANFQMIGSRTETIRQDGNVEIPVDRLAARVVVKAVKNGMVNDALASQFKLVSMYLTNGVGDVDYGRTVDYQPAKWYNRRGYEASNNLGSFMYDEVNMNIAANGSYEVPHYFYTMPNRFDPKVGLEQGENAFTPRGCRLVVRVQIAGTLYDYPIALPAIQGNKSYEINLITITKNGNKDDGEHDPNNPDDIDEEKPVEGFDQGFQVVVNDWNVVLVGDNGNITI